MDRRVSFLGLLNQDGQYWRKFAGQKDHADRIVQGCVHKSRRDVLDVATHRLPSLIAFVRRRSPHEPDFFEKINKSRFSIVFVQNRA
jgi:hypothetical protein